MPGIISHLLRPSSLDIRIARGLKIADNFSKLSISQIPKSAVRHTLEDSLIFEFLGKKPQALVNSGKISTDRMAQMLPRLNG